MAYVPSALLFSGQCKSPFRLQEALSGESECMNSASHRLGHRRHPLRGISSLDLSRRLRRAREMDLHALSEDQVLQRMRRIFDAYATRPFTIRTKGVFRARINPPETTFINAHDLWYPPASKITRPGRFNAVGESVFYASARPHAAILEVRPKVGDTVTLLVAGAKSTYADFLCAHVGMHRCQDNPAATGANGLHPRSNGDFLAELVQHGVLSKWLKIDDYLTEIATMIVESGEDETIYKATQTISKVLGSIPGVESLNYPSIAAHLKCVNVCMKPAGADRHFRPSEAWMFRITDWQQSLPGAPEAATGYYQIEPLARSGRIADDWQIEWTPNDGSLHIAQIGDLADA